MSIFTPRITAGDLNGDGYIDMALCYHKAEQFITSPQAIIMPGNADGTFEVEDPSFALDLDNCEDLQAFTPSGPGVNSRPDSSARALLAVAFDDTVNVLGWDTDWNTIMNYTVEDTARDPFGQIADLNLDGYADLMQTNGTSSLIIAGLNWDATPESDPNSRGYTFGTDIQTGGAADFNLDGNMDAYGAHDSQILIYYQSRESGWIKTFSDDNCEDQIQNDSSPTSLTTGVYNTYHLKWDDAPVPNDTIRSIGLYEVAEGTVIKLYDDPDGDESKGYTTVTVKDLSGEDGNTICTGNLDNDVSNSHFNMDYHAEEGFSTNIFNDVANKVSRIVVSLP